MRKKIPDGIARCRLHGALDQVARYLNGAQLREFMESGGKRLAGPLGAVGQIGSHIRPVGFPGFPSALALAHGWE